MDPNNNHTIPDEVSPQSPQSPPGRPRRGLRALLWVFLTPIFLFTTLMVLLYVPPIQNFIRSQATDIASEATGWEIDVERIDLRFPFNLLVRGVTVVKPAPQESLRTAAKEAVPDTLFRLESLNVQIQAMPLFKGRIEIDNVSLQHVAVNTSDLIKGTLVKGTLGEFRLKSHGIDLSKEDVMLNRIALENTHLQVVLTDTAQTPEDTATTDLRWRIRLQDLQLRNISVRLLMPNDSLRLGAYIGHAEISRALADLGRQHFAWQTFALNESALRYDMGDAPAAEGLDVNHLMLRNLNLGIDSVNYCGNNINAVIRRLTLDDRSGLSITSAEGHISSDSTEMRIPKLNLKTAHSELNLRAHTCPELLETPTTGQLGAQLDARIGKQDVMLIAGNLPQAFRESYPAHPLVIKASTAGNFKQMQISRLSMDLPGAFSLDGGGEFYDLTDSLKQSGQLDLKVKTHKLDFLTALSGSAPNVSFIIPDSMSLEALMRVDGQQIGANINLHEGTGLVHADAMYHLTDEAYRARLLVDSMRIDHFLPHDSIYQLSFQVDAAGRGTDLGKASTLARIEARLKEVGYKKWLVSDVDFKAGLKQHVATAHIRSNNQLLRMEGEADMRFDRRYLDGGARFKVDEVSLYRLGILPEPLKRPFAFTFDATARRDSVKARLDAGDLHLNFRAESTLKKLLEQGDEFMALLGQQIEDRHLNHADLRKALPSADMRLSIGQDNPLSVFLAAKDVRFSDFELGFGFSPKAGINGRTSLHGLRLQKDSVQLDTLFFTIRQDTTRMRLQGGLINGPDNPQFVFRSTLTGEIRNDDAGIMINYKDGQGRTGVDFGINARPLTEGHGKGNGLLLTLVPEHPTIAFRQFHFTGKKNWLYLHKNMRVYAGIDMDSDDGLGFSMQSNREDTLSLQNINIELSRLNLQELSEIMPYMPRLTGLFTVDANYIQKATSLQVSAEANVEKLTYEKRPVGDVGLGAIYLPEGNGKHYINAYMSYDQKEVLTADGVYRHNGKQDTLEVVSDLEHFPLKIANAFVPDGMVELAGDLDGNVHVTGSTDKPKIEGTLILDEASLYSRQTGARFRLDHRPIEISNNQLKFNKFAIYTTSENPFTIDGRVDFRNMDRPTANLTLNAGNYTLLDAKRTRESLIYGKVFVDVAAKVQGPLDALNMRGNMNLKGNTNLTYVLTDSPLTVEDRLDGLVSFVSFRDTSEVETETQMLHLGGLQMHMDVHIDNSVRLRADLSADRSKYIELIGGGDLNMQYTPQGDMTLNGRYTLTGGSMKYSLPIIPLKEFAFKQGSYVDWRGDMMNPILNLTATERMRASVSDGSSNNSSRMVNFDVSIGIKNRLSAPELLFDLDAPEDHTIGNELASMGTDERNKAAVTMLATGIYMGKSSSSGNGLSVSSALNSVLQSQINSLAGGVKNASISVGIEDHTSAETGNTQKNFSFRYAQRLFNDRVQIIIGGKVSTGSNATNTAESFIDNVSLEYRLDNQGTRYLRAFYRKNYESILDGEITEAGAGIVIRKKMDRLSELFIFKKKK